MNSEDDGERAIRCECGMTMDFTGIRRCKSCGKIVCELCKWRMDQKSYCKACHKTVRDERSRKGSDTAKMTIA